MKRTILTLVLGLCTLLASAIDMPAKRSSLELTFGDPFPLNMLSWSYSCGCGPVMNGDYDGELVYHGVCHHADIVIPTINLAYHYAVLPWLEVGATAGASVDLRPYYYNGEKTLFGGRQAYLMADARFTYLRKEIITLYSGFGVGLELDYHDCDHAPLGTRELHYLAAGQLTAFGMQLGRRVYWSLELGFGTKGIANTGIGVRF